MGLISDLKTVYKGLKRYKYINSFYNILASSTNDASVNPDTLANEDLTKEEINEVVNWFKGSNNIAKAEMDSAINDVTVVIHAAEKIHPIRFYILRCYVDINLAIEIFRLSIISIFARDRFDDKMVSRAYEYMLEVTDMEEEEDDEEFYTSDSGDNGDKKASE